MDLEYLTQRLSTRKEKWLNRRIPKAGRYQLDNQSIFILPTKFGYVFLFFSILLFVFGTNYQANTLIMLSFILIALFIVHMFASFLNFARLYVSIGHIQPVFAGTTAAIPLQILPSQSDRPTRGTLWVSFWQTKRYQSIELDTLQGTANIRYFAQQRGIGPLPRMTLQCDYPLGLFRCWTHLQFIQPLTVYPQPIAGTIPLEQIAQLAKDTRSTAMGGKALDQPDDFDSLVAYQHGDPLHSVAWKQLAKTGDMLRKRFSGTSPEQGYLSLPMHGNIEKGLSQLAYQINQCHNKNAVYGLFLPTQTIAPNHSEAHKQACLAALAEFPISANVLQTKKAPSQKKVASYE
ncbi:MAG: DUF58 domain-containing protein [Glaciecola sp.]|nr:DUF58 domain-containing protein [Glaciecola sp.]MDG1814659.1 DUF58 domain-containing protein [Glaciecola sp.]MDG2100275.1 DUF58 domain-containing protein [Glaciecola sp.]